MDECMICRGTGQVGYPVRTCIGCEGTGKAQLSQREVLAIAMSGVAFRHSEMCSSPCECGGQGDMDRLKAYARDVLKTNDFERFNLEDY